MKIANIGYQTNYSNNKSNNKGMKNSVQFASLQACASEPVKKVGKLRTLANIIVHKIKNNIAPTDVKAADYVAESLFPIVAPRNVNVIRDIFLDGFKIKGQYTAGGYARINHTLIAENGKFSAGTHLSAFDSSIKGAADSKGNAYISNTKIAKGGHLTAQNAYFYDGSTVGGSVTTAQSVVIRQGSELSKGGISHSDELVVGGEIRGHAVARMSTIKNTGSIEKKGELWTEHAHFEEFLPSEGRVTAEKITIGKAEEPRLVFTKQDDLPQNYRNNITIKKSGWYKDLVNSTKKN